MNQRAWVVRKRAALDHEELAEGFTKLVAGQWRVAEVRPFLSKVNAMAALSAPFLIERLASSDPRERDAATLLLRQMAGPRVIAPVRDLLRSRATPDGARTAAAAVLQAQGDAINAQAVASDLKDPHGVFESIWEGMLAQVHDSAFLVELLGSFESAPATEREELVRFLAEPGDHRALLLLLPLLRSRRTGIVLAAVDAIEALGGTTALEELKEVSEADPSPRVRRRARAAYGRLHMRASSFFPDPETPRLLHPAPEPPLERAWVTLLDGQGCQAVAVARRNNGDTLQVMFALVSDSQGLLECHGANAMRAQELQEIEERLASEGMPPVPVGLEQCRRTLEAARALTLRLRQRPPLGYEVWKGLLGNREAACRATAPAALAPPRDFSTLLPHTHELMAMPEFKQWALEPGLVWPYADEWAQLSPEQQAEEQGRATLSQLVDLAAADLVDQQLRRVLGRRLRTQAALLLALGKHEAARLAEAAAQGLDPQTGVPSALHPFVRALLVTSLQRAGLRLPEAEVAEKGWEAVRAIGPESAASTIGG